MPNPCMLVSLVRAIEIDFLSLGLRRVAGPEISHYCGGGFCLGDAAAACGKKETAYLHSLAATCLSPAVGFSGGLFPIGYLVVLSLFRSPDLLLSHFLSSCFFRLLLITGYFLLKRSQPTLAFFFSRQWRQASTQTGLRSIPCFHC